MTVIAWDGKSICADKQSTCEGMRRTTTKLVTLEDGTVLGAVGNTSTCHLLRDWYISGAKTEDFPKEWEADLIVVKNGECFVYEKHSIPIKIEDPFIAFGSGKELALGAMAMGATARQAVEVAIRFCTGCGMGIQECPL